MFQNEYMNSSQEYNETTYLPEHNSKTQSSISVHDCKAQQMPHNNLADSISGQTHTAGFNSVDDMKPILAVSCRKNNDILSEPSETENKDIEDVMPVIQSYKSQEATKSEEDIKEQPQVKPTTQEIMQKRAQKHKEEPRVEISESLKNKKKFVPKIQQQLLKNQSHKSSKQPSHTEVKRSPAKDGPEEVKTDLQDNKQTAP